MGKFDWANRVEQDCNCRTKNHVLYCAVSHNVNAG